MLADFRLYSRSPDGPWISYSEGSAGTLRASFVGGRMSGFLDRADLSTAAVPFRPIPIKREEIPAYLGLPPGDDGTKWVIGARVDAGGLFDFLASHGNESALFGVALFALSFLLGRLFSVRFTRPLKALAAAAERYGSGDPGGGFASMRRDEIGVLSRKLAEMASEIEGRRSETEERLRTMEAMNRIDKAVLSTASRTELLSRVAEIVNGLLSAHSVAIALRDRRRASWVLAALTGVESLPLDRAEAKMLPAISDELLDAETMLRVTGYYEAPLSASPPGFVFFAFDVMGAPGGRIVSAPLYVDGRFLGALAIVLEQDRALSAEQRRAVAMLSDQTAVAVRSLLEQEAKEENFLGILQALTRAIDAKSRWTAGHSERVAETAVALGLKLQMQENELRSLRIAAILHDAGKLGVRESVLDKPGRLEPAEYEEIKRHPSLGGKILAGIRSFESVVPAIVHHHERWDGAGYPDGLAGEEIPIAARIIAVADVWDAITDDRPYRAGFPRDKAIGFMVENSGALFDPRLVRIFLDSIRPEAER